MGKSIILVFAVIVVALVLGFLLRGWFRNTVIPGYVTTVYGGKLETVFESELTELGGVNMFSRLGMRNSGEPIDCRLSTAEAFKTTVWCIVSTAGIRKMSNPEDLQTFAPEFQALHQKLLANGWQGGRQPDLAPPPATFALPFGWYSYSKNINGMDCNVQFADSSGLLDGSFWCSHTYGFL